MGVGRQTVLNRERRSDFPRLGRYSVRLGGGEEGGDRESPVPGPQFLHMLCVGLFHGNRPKMWLGKGELLRLLFLFPLELRFPYPGSEQNDP